MGFSYTLEIDGISFSRFGNLKIRESADGFGISGASRAELTFTVPYSEYLLHSPPPNAKVEIYAGENYRIAQTFYISSRSRKGGTVSFTCYDRMMFADQKIAFYESDFNDIFHPEQVGGYWLLGKIAGQCGFNGYGVINITELPDIYVPREKVEGRSGMDILQMLSSAWAGFFKVSNDDTLTFVPFGETVCSIPGSIDIIRHAAVSEGNTKGPITQVIMSDGKNEYISGSNGADVFNTLKISSELASQELASALMKRIKGYVYQAWECSKIAYTSVVTANTASITAEIGFADGVSRTANYMEKSLTAYGIFISCGANDVTESEFDYTGKLSREIAQKLTDGEELGNKTLITRYQGTIHLGEKEESGGARSAAEPPKRYGYAPATYEGVVKFDGAMVDKTLPEITVKDDLSGFSTVYGGTVIEYGLEWDGDNVTLKEKEAGT